MCSPHSGHRCSSSPSSTYQHLRQYILGLVMGSDVGTLVWSLCSFPPVRFYAKAVARFSRHGWWNRCMRGLYRFLIPCGYPRRRRLARAVCTTIPQDLVAATGFLCALRLVALPGCTVWSPPSAAPPLPDGRGSEKDRYVARGARATPAPGGLWRRQRPRPCCYGGSGTCGIMIRVARSPPWKTVCFAVRSSASAFWSAAVL